MTPLFHITTRGEWERAQRAGAYEAASLAIEGFIHCSKAHQVVGSANRYFRGAKDLVLLVIDEGAVSSPIRYEPPVAASADRTEPFPHVYGPLDVDAVVRVLEFPSDPDGTFRLPDAVG